MKNKRKKKCMRPKCEIKENKRRIYEYIGLPGEVLSGEPKIVMTGDCALEFYNHKGIIDISDTQIKINTKRAIYLIKGINLFVSGMTDDEIEISGKIMGVEIN